jgi:hypothetical protein
MTSWSTEDTKTRLERLKQLDHFTAPALTDQLLAMPTDDGGFEKLNIALRDPDL